MTEPLQGRDMMLIFRDRLSLFNVPVLLLGGLKHLCETKKPHKYTPENEEAFPVSCLTKSRLQIDLKTQIQI